MTHRLTGHRLAGGLLAAAALALATVAPATIAPAAASTTGVSTGGGGSTAVPSAADPSADGLWYYTVPGIDQAHATTTGAGVTIAVLEGPINPDVPDLAGTDLVTHPGSFCESFDQEPPPGVSTAEDAVHATNMASLLVGTGAGVDGQPGVLGVAPDARVLHYAITGEEAGCEVTGLAAGIDAAVQDGADIINVSWTGAQWDEDAPALARAQRAGVIVVAASGRGFDDRDLGWPGSANGVVTVEAADVNLQLSPQAVPSPRLAVVAPGQEIRTLSWSDGAWDTYTLSSGASGAAVWTAGVLALVRSAYPDATANQVIQSLLRNTSGHGGELSRDDTWGYGAVSVAELLAADPTAYPDTNPLLLDEIDSQPTYDEVVGAGSAPDESAAPSDGSEEPSPTPTGSPSTDAGDDDGGLPLPALLALGLGVLVLLGVLITVVARRRAGARPTRPTL